MIFQLSETLRLTKSYRHAGAHLLVPGMFQVKGALTKTSLEWTIVHPGIFLEYFVFGRPTYVERFPVAVDIDATVAGVPGSGKTPVSFTYTFDIGRFVAKLLSLEKQEKEYLLAGDNSSYNNVVAIVEAAKGVQMKVTYDLLKSYKWSGHGDRGVQEDV